MMMRDPQEWYDAMVAKGHTPQMHEDNDWVDRSGIDMFASSYGFHNGPVCTVCHWSCCEHCKDIAAIPNECKE